MVTEKRSCQTLTTGWVPSRIQGGCRGGLALAVPVLAALLVKMIPVASADEGAIQRCGFVSQERGEIELAIAPLHPTFTLGEPILILARLRNAGREAGLLRDGHVQFVQWRMYRSDGSELQSFFPCQGILIGGVTAEKVPPGRSQVHMQSLAEVFPIRQPGEYRVQAAIGHARVSNDGGIESTNCEDGTPGTLPLLQCEFKVNIIAPDPGDDRVRSLLYHPQDGLYQITLGRETLLETNPGSVYAPYADFIYILERRTRGREVHTVRQLLDFSTRYWRHDLAPWALLLAAVEASRTNTPIWRRKCVEELVRHWPGTLAAEWHEDLWYPPTLDSPWQRR